MTPGPVSVGRPSIGMRISAASCSSALAHGARTLQHAPQRRPRAYLFGMTGKLAEKQQHAALERQGTAGFGKQPHRSVRKGRVPTGKGDVVVLLVVGIPPQHDVAESHSLLERGKKFLALDVLAAQDPVIVEDPDLDILQAALLDDRPGLRAAAHLFWLHDGSSSVSRRSFHRPCLRTCALWP